MEDQPYSISAIITTAVATLITCTALAWALRMRYIRKGTPPGTLGWPLIGETLEFLSSQRQGKPEEFLQKRVDKHGKVFTTSLAGHRTVVMCGPEAHRFMFANENKLIAMWWPPSVSDMFGKSMVNTTGSEAKRLRRVFMTFLNPDALQTFTSQVCRMTLSHFTTHWNGKDGVLVFPLVKKFTLSLACTLFLSLNSLVEQERLTVPFLAILKGLLQLPLDLPGTRYNKAKRGRRQILKLLDEIVRERRQTLSSTDKSLVIKDFLSYLISFVGDDGKGLCDEEIKDNIILLLITSHDTSTCALTMLIKLLAENPQCYERVLQEHMEIASGKQEGEVLQWADFQKMKYSWKALLEAVRLYPPVSGSFHKVIKEFTYQGYRIPKGWKAYWSPYSTHRNNEYFKDAERYDPGRFEGEGPTPYTSVPFGGGVRVCPGMEFARMEIMVFLHQLVMNFKWELIDPSEKVTVDPVPAPAKGLPIRLVPRCSKFNILT